MTDYTDAERESVATYLEAKVKEPDVKFPNSPYTPSPIRKDVLRTAAAMIRGGDGISNMQELPVRHTTTRAGGATGPISELDCRTDHDNRGNSHTVFSPASPLPDAGENAGQIAELRWVIDITYDAPYVRPADAETPTQWRLRCIRTAIEARIAALSETAEGGEG